ncbi:hypothetical protein BpHYR1_048892 [Brachionus plicatilis]|uniref:Uncharacterized protein n=1 Tax=Brachionus plicatilis TaxID=10195 RepID=A0A3M7SS55_BRAPC|nr:hypothetical protein BpHYR1_048892 [Brachionus plicatilis]
MDAKLFGAKKNQPPKPPERSCSFKDVDNLNQPSPAQPPPASSSSSGRPSSRLVHKEESELQKVLSNLKKVSGSEASKAHKNISQLDWCSYNKHNTNLGVESEGKKEEEKRSQSVNDLDEKKGGEECVSSTSSSCCSSSSTEAKRANIAHLKKTIEYASFNIKPSQYKQTGVFLPLNNSGEAASGANACLIMLRYVKEDLEIFVQKLRNVKKSGADRAEWSLFVQFKEQFCAKTNLELNNLNSWSNEQNYDLLLKLRQALIKVKAFEQSDSQNGQPNALDLSALSKLLNDFMHNLDKLTQLVTQQATTPAPLCLNVYSFTVQYYDLISIFEIKKKKDLSKIY